MKQVLTNGTVVEVLLTGSRIMLPGGEVVEGEPQDTDSYRATADRLGYDTTLAMCQDHDPLHALLCDWLGLPSSFALRVAAGLDAESPLARAEEDAVLALQRFMRLAKVALPRRIET